MASVALGKLSIHYSDAGRGPAVLLLHAFPLHREMWLPQVEALAGQYRVIALDARGLGQSRPAPESLTMELYADDAAAVLDHLGINKVVVAGLSMGGYAALAFAKRHRTRLGGLVLADTRATADSDEGRAGRLAFIDQAAKFGMDWVATEMLPKLQRQQPLPHVEAELRRLIRTNTVLGVAAAQRGMARRADATQDLSAIACPTLVMVGEEDRLTPPAMAQELATAIPNAKLITLSGAGHVANLEDPARFNVALLDFLQALKSTPLPP